LNKIKDKTHEDVTKEWLEKATPNSHDLVLQSYYEHNGKKYFVDGKYVIYDNSKDELETANWLKQTLGGEIIILPRINVPENIKTPDYLFRDEKWDLKKISGKTKNTIDSILLKSKHQANNFIVDITNSKLTDTKVKNVIDNIYKHKNRKWINQIIIKRHNELIYVFKRKNKSH